MNKIFLICAMTLNFFTSIDAAPGALDATFGLGGKVVIPGFGIPESAAIQADGKIIVGSGSNVFRFNTDGSLDTTFGGDGNVSTQIGQFPLGAEAVAIQSDGKIVAAGESFDNNNLYDFAVVRYNADGTLDNSFGSNGVAITRFAATTAQELVSSMGIQTDGKIVVVGYVDTGSSYNFAVARYNADGSLDSSFDFDGRLTTAVSAFDDIARSMAIQADGKIVLCGETFHNADFHFTVVRYNADGSLDTSFDTDGIAKTPIGIGSTPRSTAIQTNGKIVIAGYSINDGQFDFTVARYNTDGSLDTSFDADGIVITNFGANSDAYSVLVQPNGKIVAAGTNNTSFGDFAIVRFNADGSLDNSLFEIEAPNVFGTGGKAIIEMGGGDSARDIAVQSDGKFVVIGAAEGDLNNNGHKLGIARLLGDLAPPTAANVSVSGHVISSDKQGIGRAAISLTDSSGNTRHAVTNSFGNYRFDEIRAGRTYVISVAHKKYVFTPASQVLNISEDLSGIDFTANE